MPCHESSYVDPSERSLLKRGRFRRPRAPVEEVSVLCAMSRHAEHVRALALDNGHRVETHRNLLHLQLGFRVLSLIVYLCEGVDHLLLHRDPGLEG